MAWTETTRRNYFSRTLRYASDVTDREWDFVAAIMPPSRRLGRPRKTELRDVLNALLYIASTGCQWRILPKDFPPCSTVQRYFYEWRAMGLWSRINHHRVMEAQELEGREASPTPGAIAEAFSSPTLNIDSQKSPRTAHQCRVQDRHRCQHRLRRDCKAPRCVDHIRPFTPPDGDGMRQVIRGDGDKRGTRFRCLET
jgi:transposase